MRRSVIFKVIRRRVNLILHGDRRAVIKRKQLGFDKDLLGELLYTYWINQRKLELKFLSHRIYMNL